MAAEPLPATALRGPDSPRSGLSRWTGAVVGTPLAEPAWLVLLAVLTGAIGGVGAMAFRLMIRGVRLLCVHGLVGHAWPLPAPERPWLLALLPAAGLLLVGWISRRFAPEVRGHGVPQVLEALALNRGRIPPRVGLFGMIAPAITLGTLGSAGREGPIAQIGAAFGSSLGQLLRLGDSRTSLLLACGAGAGIAATFNAPIGGAFFALEIVLGSYAMGAVVPVFIAAVTGTAVFDAVWGHGLSLAAPPYQFTHPYGAVFMLPLGLAAGACGLAYTHGLIAAEDLLGRWRAGWPWKALAGGLLVGGLGLFLPQVLGVGYASVGQAVAGHLGLALLLGLLVGKYLATITTLASGGSGGVFAPALYLGAMLGGAYGDVLHRLLPGGSSPGPVYAVAGMGAILAGSGQAPLTAIFIVLEMTGDWQLAAGVAAACAIGYLVHGSLSRDSMDTLRLTRRGVRILRGAEVRPLQRVPVAAALRPLGTRLYEDESVATAMARLEDHGALLVFRRDDSLLGLVEARHLLQAAARCPERPVGEYCDAPQPVLSPAASLDDAMRRFGTVGAELLPVGDGPGGVVGTLSRADVLRAYYNRTVLTLETRGRIDLLREEAGSGEDGAFREVALPLPWAGEGGAVAEFDLPPGVVIVSVERGGAHLTPGGSTALRGGDRVLVHAASLDAADTAEQRLRQAATRHRGLFADVELPGTWDGECILSALRLPAGALLVAVRRGPRVIVPRGDTALRGGDTVTVCAEGPAALRAARQALLAPSPP